MEESSVWVRGHHTTLQYSITLAYESCDFHFLNHSGHNFIALKIAMGAV